MIRFSILHMINTLLPGNDSADWLSQILGLQELIESKVSLGKRLVVQTWAPAKDGGRRHRNFILPWAGANCRTAHGLGHSLALGLADEIIDLRREGRLCGHLRRRACHVHLGRLGELEAPSQPSTRRKRAGTQPMPPPTCDTQSGSGRSPPSPRL